MDIPVVNFKGEPAGTIELPEKIFGLKPSREFLHEVVTSQRANRRRWTAHTKTRAEVSGGGHKPWKQKHTGRARAGSNRSPLWRKGGVVFGPRSVDPALRRVVVSRRKARLALAQALSARAADGSLRVVDQIALDGSKTRQVAEFLKCLDAREALIVLEQPDKGLSRAGRNIPGLKLMPASCLSAYEVLRCRRLIFTKAAVEKMRSGAN